jgi:hypothetical protein
MYAQFCNTWQTVTRSLTTHARRTVTLTKLSIISAILVTASLIKTWTGSSWVDWADYGGTFTGTPYAVQYNNDMYVFGRAKGDNTNWKKYWSYSGGTWNGWTQLGTTTMAGDPSAYQYGSSELDTFVTGSDTKTYKDTYNGSTWGGFTSM